jgi:hypothetical protein
MARYILCSVCNDRMARVARKHTELFESIAGTAIKDMLCDGGCSDQTTEIKKGDTCYAAVSLPSIFHANYAIQKPSVWAHEFIKPIQ